ncbi:MAG: HEAT repeat domain-containing protein [Capsulimonadales bacterium]|nr:HEAT repeat domain-containing protein [Capsulimonadales bacterium]
MKRTLFPLITLVGWLTGTACAQEDPFARLKTYDFQQRQVVEELRVEVQKSLAEPTNRARLEDGLIAVLRDPTATFAGKQEACHLLRMLGAERSVAVLIGLLGDERTADIARYGLESSPSPTVAKSLMTALKTARGKRAVGIINTLGNRGAADAAPALVPLVTHPDRMIADAAVVALGKIGTPSAIAVLRATEGRPLLVGQALLRAGDRLAAGGKPVQAAELYAFQAKRGRESAVRVAALRRLASVDPKQALAIGQNALTASDERVAATAGNVVATVADRATVRKSVPAWRKLPPVALMPLLAGLTARREAAALPLAESALTAENELLRVTAVQALATLGGAKAVPTLVTVAATGQGETKQAARVALVQLPGADADAAILRTAKTGEKSARLALLGILAERGTGEDVALLTASVADADETIVTEALKAVERHRVPMENGVLLRTLTDTSSETVREAAQSTLVANARLVPGTEDALIAALEPAAPPVKAILLGALARIGGDRGLTELSKAVGSSDADVKTAAITGLAETWGDARPLPLLLATAKTDAGKTYRIQALRGYFRLLGQEERMPPAERVAKVKDGIAAAERPEEKQQALGILRETRVPEAMELANAALDDPALFDVAADTALYLAAEQKKGDATLPAVKGPATLAALNKIAQKATDDTVKGQARKLLGS